MKRKTLNITIPEGYEDLFKGEYFNNKAYVFDKSRKMLNENFLATVNNSESKKDDQQLMEDLFLMLHREFQEQPENWLYRLNVLPLEKIYRQYEKARHRFNSPRFYSMCVRQVHYLLKDAEIIKHPNQ